MPLHHVLETDCSCEKPRKGGNADLPALRSAREAQHHDALHLHLRFEGIPRRGHLAAGTLVRRADQHAILVSARAAYPCPSC